MIRAENLFPSLAGHGAISIDCETYDPDLGTKGPGTYRGGYMVGVAVATDQGFARYYPVRHEAGGNLELNKVTSWLGTQLTRPGQPKVGANLLYDLGYLAKDGVKPTGPFYDIQIAEPLLNETRYQYDLETLAQEYLKEGKHEEQMIAMIVARFGKKNPKGNIWRTPPDIVAPYAIEDARLPLRIFALQKLELEKQELWDLFITESKLIPLLLAMRQRGVRVDLSRAEQMRDELAKRQRSLVRKIGTESIWNAADLAKVFDRHGVSYGRTKKTDKPSFTKASLEYNPHPIAKLVFEARKIDKLRSVFLESFILGNAVNGRVHCSFNQLRSDDGGTVSGRFSSSHPNLQQIPVRTEEGKLIRTIFLPDNRQRWVKLDYSQIEFRLIVHDAVDMGLKGAEEIAEKFRTDPTTDFHAETAKLAGIERYPGKTMNFSLVYGAGVGRISAQLGVDLEEGERLIAEYHEKVPFIRGLSKEVRGWAVRDGEIKTMFGRRRRFKRWVEHTADGDKYYDERQAGASMVGIHTALNARIQGSAADIIKLAMVEIWESGACDDLGAPHLTVHDELDFSVPKQGLLNPSLLHVRKIMERITKLCLPLKVDASIGANWGEAR